jgi:hypothetical protein
MSHLTVLDPVAESTIVRQQLAPRLTIHAGNRIWFLDNQGQAWSEGPPRMNPIFQVWQERLSREHEIKWDYVCTQQFTSPFRHGKEKLEEIARSADAVVNGLACCGSGTSAVIHDAVRYELRGVPSVSLVTDSVAGHAKAATMKLGMTDLPVLVVSHNIHMFSPVATPEECARAADALYPAMVAALLGKNP